MRARRLDRADLLVYQVHPAKLAADIGASAASNALLWRHRALVGLSVQSPTRERFFREARRVLRVGGRLAIADVILGGTRRDDLKSRMIDRLHRRLRHIPNVNMYPAQTYARKLVEAGFTNVRVESIASDVFAPYLAYCEWFAGAAPERGRLNPLLRVGPSAMKRLGWFDQYDYVIATAEKPPPRAAAARS